MKVLPLYILLLLPFFGFCAPGSNNPSVKLNVTNSLFLSYSNANEMLAPKVIENALELEVKTGRGTFNVMATINFSDPMQNDVFAGKVAMKLRTNTSYNASVNSAIIPLYATPSLLFTQPATNNTEHFVFLYDIVVGPFDSFVNTGDFNYSINVTISQP